MNAMYFFIGTLSTMSLNSLLSQLSDTLFTNLISLLGGVLSAMAVAWLRRRWERE